MSIEYSVLMSVYYKEKAEFFDESIKSMLAQKVPPYEFVIVCDGPLTDELNQIIEKYDKRFRGIFNIVRLEECSGLGNALNEGLKHCKYNIVARMDSDDIAKENRMKEQLNIFNNNDVDMVGAAVEEFDKNVNHITAIRRLPQKHEDILKFAKRRNPFNHPCMTFKKDAVLKAGGYQEFPLFEDYYLWVRMLMNGAKGYNIDKSLLFMRSGEGMYKRRGGLSYAKKAVKFRWHLKNMGFSTMKDFIISAGGQVMVCIIPNGFRKIIYKLVLRR